MENIIIQSKIFNHRKFKYDIAYIIFTDLLFLSLVLFRHFSESFDSSKPVVYMSGLIISIFLLSVFTVRVIQLIKLTGTKHLGKQMRRHSFMFIAAHSSVIVFMVFCIFYMGT